MKPQHEKSNVLHQKCNETKKDASADSNECVGPHGKYFFFSFFQTYQINHQRSEDKTRQKHGCFETSVAKKSAKDAKKQIEHANCCSHHIVGFVAEKKGEYRYTMNKFFSLILYFKVYTR